MAANKDDLINSIRKSLRDIEGVSSELAHAAWMAGVYEQGWNARQLLCHLAAGARFPATMIGAARICDHAEASQIVAADVVRQLAAGKQFLFSDIGEVVPKGFEEPVRLYEVRWREEA